MPSTDTVFLTSNTLIIKRGQAVRLGEENINGTWVNGEHSALVFNALDVTNGFFSESGTATTPIFSFSQQQVRNGAILFTHDSSDAAPFYRLSIQQLNETTYTPTIYFTGYCLRESVLVTDQGIVTYPKIAASDASVFVVWEDRAALDGDSWGILSRAYNADLTPISNQSVVNIYTSGTQNDPAMISLPSGYAVGWDSADQISNEDAYLRIYDGNGDPTTNEVLINAFYTSYNQQEARLTALNNGNLMAVWRAHHGLASYQTYGQVFDVSGNLVGGDFRVNTNTATAHIFQSIVSLTNGNVVAAWAEAASPPESNPTTTLRGRIISNTGVGVSNEFTIDSGRATVSTSSIAPLDTGGFVIAWIARDDPSAFEAYNFYIRIFDASGNSVTSRLIVNDPVYAVTHPVIASFDNYSKFMVIWSSDGLNAKVYYSDGRVCDDAFSLNVPDSLSSLHGFTDNRLLIAWGRLYAAYIEEEQSPTIHTHAIDLLEDAYIVLSPNEMHITDDDDIVIHVENVNNGQFEAVRFAGDAITQFAGQALNSGEIAFVHTGGHQPSSYDMYATDGYLQTATAPAQITFTRRRPLLINNAWSIENDTVRITLTRDEIWASSAPVSGVLDEDLLIVLDNVSGGFFSYVNTSSAIDSFQQQALDDGDIQFTHDQSGRTPSVDVVASDGAFESLPSASQIALKEAPTIHQNPIQINNNATITIDPSVLNSTLPVGANKEVLFTFSNIQNGRFLDRAQGNVTVTTCTQEQIDRGDIQFQPNSSDHAPSWMVRASHNGFVSMGVSPDIYFTANNQTAPRIVENSWYVKENSQVTLGRRNLRTVDQLNQPVSGDTEFIVNDVTHAYFSLASAPSVPLSTFTQRQLAQGDILFTHDGSDQSPTCEIVARQGLLYSAVSKTVVVFSIAAITLTPSDRPTQSPTEWLGRPRFERAHVRIRPEEPLLLSAQNILAVSVPGLPAKHLEIRVDQLLDGSFEKSSNNANYTKVKRFTQAEINAGRIRFVPDASGRTPSFDLWVQDTLNNRHSLAITVDVELIGAPEVCVEEASIEQGDSQNMAAVLYVCQTDDAGRHRRLLSDESFNWQVAGVDNAKFQWVSLPNVPLMQFNQTAIDTGLVWFLSDGGKDAPRYGISVSDGVLSSAVEWVSVTYTSDSAVAPKITTNRLLLLPELPTSLTSEYLVYDKGTAMTIDVLFSEVSGGYFSLRNQPDIPQARFSEAQFLNAEILLHPEPGQEITYFSQILGDQLNSAREPARVIDAREGALMTALPTNASSSSATLVGIAAGGAAALLLVGGFFAYRQCHKKPQSSSEQQSEMTNTEGLDLSPFVVTPQ